MAECPICMEEDVKFVAMECGHELCDACLKKIMDVSKECPMCRLPLTEAPKESAFCQKIVCILCFASICLTMYITSLRH
jgi:hypothetical protein